MCNSIYPIASHHNITHAPKHLVVVVAAMNGWKIITTLLVVVAAAATPTMTTATAGTVRALKVRTNREIARVPLPTAALLAVAAIPVNWPIRTWTPW